MSNSKCLRVLYVEDDDATRDALCLFLKPRVGKVIAAATGEEGLKKFEEYKPNLIIVDLILPEMSGLELIASIRERDKKCKIMITTTLSEVKTVLDAVDLKIENYIIKPIDTEDFEKKLDNVGDDICGERNGTPGIVISNAGVVEDMVRRYFIKMLKTYTGKGPVDLKVLLINQQLELHVMDAFTAMEKTILSNKRHISLVEQHRKLFYEVVGAELEEFVGSAVGSKARIVTISVDGFRKIDKLVLTIGDEL